jgi:2-haloacid dehalogenase
MKSTKKRSPAIIFDLGGVLIDWNPYYLYRKMFGDDPQAVANYLKAVDFSGWNKEQDRGRSFAEGTEALIAQFPQYRELILAYDERYLEAIGGIIQPTVEILRTLKELEYPLYGLSNWPAEKFALVRPIYAFFAWFDDLVISGEVKLIKPEKDIFQLLLQRIGRPSGECLFIDDHEANILTARELGFQTIHFHSPRQLQAELQNRTILNGNHSPAI